MTPDYNSYLHANRFFPDNKTVDSLLGVTMGLLLKGSLTWGSLT
jgi:hypothetical protein